MLAEYLGLPSIDKAKELLENAKRYRDFNQHEKALQALDQAMTVAPELAEIYELKREILTELDRPDEAMQAYTKLMKLRNKELILKGRSFRTQNGATIADKSALIAGTPWISILFRPRDTIRWILDTDPNRHFFLIAALLGIGISFNIFMRQFAELELSLFMIIILTLVLGPIIGIVSFYLASALYQWVGNILGGSASFDEVKASLAWSSIPTLLNCLILLPVITFSSQYLTKTLVIENLTPETNLPPQVLALTGLLCGLLIPMLILGIWSWVLNVVCMAEVHKFSIWRSIATMVTPALILGGFSCCCMGTLI